MRFEMSASPAWKFGEGLADEIGAFAAPIAFGPHALIVADPYWVAAGLVGRMREALLAEGIETSVYADFAGEPKLTDLDTAITAARAAGIVIGVGGGSTLDLAKCAAVLAQADAPAAAYCLAARPLPRDGLPMIALPTTAGTGSEFSATNIFSSAEGKKSWIWGAETKPHLVLMDPTLTMSLPATLTAWTGMDAFVHAFEACTNTDSHPGADLVAHPALARIAGALPRAVADGADLDARGALLLGSGLAGMAIDACGTAVAHNLSHALAGLAPVHHGLATALAFELTLPWRIAQRSPGLVAAAAALGLPGTDALPGFVTALMDAAGVDRRLPVGFGGHDVPALLAEIAAPENAPMLRRTPGDFAAVAPDIAARLLALA